MVNITVVGIGYVGLSNALLLSQHNDVTALDIDHAKVAMLNSGVSPIKDKNIEDFLAAHSLNLLATTDKDKAYRKADYVVISTPTDYDPVTRSFDCSSVISTIHDAIRINPKASIIIRSTVPVGFTNEIIRQTDFDNIAFVPEFLREATSLYDSLHPSRIVIGGSSSEASAFAELLTGGAITKNVPMIKTGTTEAEAIKLFSHTFLAMRVAFFNEIDTFATFRSLDSKEIIDGVCGDPRIGEHYNNPSFGYGGYCLPKDTSQLLTNYQDVPQNLILAIVNSNATRKDFIADQIINLKPEVVGVYHLSDSNHHDEIRAAAVQGVMKRIKAKGIEVVVYEPRFRGSTYFNSVVLRDLDKFKSMADIILANRISDELYDVTKKVFTRDFSDDNFYNNGFQKRKR